MNKIKLSWDNEKSDKRQKPGLRIKNHFLNSLNDVSMVLCCIPSSQQPKKGNARLYQLLKVVKNKIGK